MSLLDPLAYQYMQKALLVTTLIGGVCGLLSAFLMLKGWSLMGDALSHAIVPGVAGAYMLGLPFSLGAFVAGGMAASVMLFLHQRSQIKQDAIIGLIFSSFFAFGLFLVSISPVAVDIQQIMLGNLLAIAPFDAMQMLIIALVSLTVLAVKWRDFMLTFFDESHARCIGLPVVGLKVLFFALLSACTMAALKSVGAFLVICLVIAPGATAYLLSDRFGPVLVLSGVIGTLTSLFGVYISYFANVNAGALIVLTQVALFLAAFVLAPKHGLFARRAKRQEALQ